jgi:hypothetical protein
VKKIEVFNIDTLEYRVGTANYRDLKSFLLSLENLKFEVQDKQTRQIIHINGQAFEVYSTGVLGEYAYHISNDKYHLYFRKPDTVRPEHIKVKINQNALWLDGSYQAVEQARKNLQSIGAVITSEIPSRVDLACHSDRFKMSRRKIGRMVSRITKIHEYMQQLDINEKNIDTWTSRRINNIESLYFGKGDPVLLRIYNKSIDCEVKGKQWFYRLWQEIGLDIEKPIINVEFQCRSKLLQEMKLNTVDEVFQNLKELWKYLTYEWFSFRQPPKDKEKKDNISRRPFSRDWKWIQDAGTSFDVNALVRDRKKEVSIEALKPGLLGYMSSYAARLGVKDRVTFFNEISDLIWSYEKKEKVKLKDMDEVFEGEKVYDFMNLVRKKIALEGNSCEEN